MKIFEEEKVIKGIPTLICKREDGSGKPLVIMSHGFTGNKNDFRDNLKELAELGYYAVAIDNRLHGSRPGPNFSTAVINSRGNVDLYLLRKAMKETADDVKILIDELSAVEEIQQNHIAMIGVSMGGFVTYRAAVIDKRIKVAIPIISSPYWDDIPGDIPVLKDQKVLDELNSLSEQYQPSQHLQEYYPTALVMQIGGADNHYNINRIQEFYDKLRCVYRENPKRLKLIIYPDTKHIFKPEMWEEALNWLKIHCGDNPEGKSGIAFAEKNT